MLVIPREALTLFQGRIAHNVQSDDSMDTPLEILDKAIRAVPPIKYALGVAGIVAAIAIVASMHISYTLAAFGTVVMFVLMTTLVVFARVARTSNESMHIPALVFTWFALLLTMSTAFLLFLSVFFGIPVNLQRVFAPLDPKSIEGPGPLVVSAEQQEVGPFTSTAMGLKVQNLPPPEGLSDAQIVQMSLPGPKESLPEIRAMATVLETDLTTPFGLKVLRVTKESPAFHAGIKESDLVSEISSFPVWNRKQWAFFADALNQRSSLDLEIWREGKPIEVSVRVGDRLQLYTHGCELKDADACYGLGLLHEEGGILDKNILRAKFYFKIACDSKSGSACSELGTLIHDPSLLHKGCVLRDGAGCRRYGSSLKLTDPKLATKNLSAACDYGDPFGCLELASFYGTALTPSKAHELYSRACWWGAEDGCKNLDPQTYERVKSDNVLKAERFQNEPLGPPIRRTIPHFPIF